MLVKEISEKAQEKSFEFSFGTLNISKERYIYNAIFSKYWEIALNAGEEFGKMWASKEDCFEKFDFVEEAFDTSLQMGISEMKNDLISMGIYDIDAKAIYDFCNQKGAFAEIQNAYGVLSQKLQYIVNELEGKMAEREFRKDNRGQWTGARFSSGNEGLVDSYVEDAKFQLELGARNLAEGIGYSVFNAIGNEISKSNANKKAKAVIEDDETILSLQRGVASAVSNLHYALIIMLDKQNDWQTPTPDEQGKAERLLNNVDNEMLSTEEKNKMLQDVFALNPYMDEYYLKLMELFPKESKAITEMAVYFCVDLVGAKDEMAMEFVKSNIGETEEDAIRCREKLKAYCEEIDLEFSEDLESVQTLNEIIEQYDIQYRTVDSILCSTRESADESRAELEQIQEFMKSVVPPDRNALLDYEQALLLQKTEFEEKFHSEIAPKYLEVINEHLQTFEKNFCSVGLFSTLGRKEAGVNRAIKFAKGLDVSTEESVEASKEKLREFLPLVGVEESEVQEAFACIDKNREKFLNPSAGQKLMNKFGGFLKK